jgi:hypothetical protein
MANVKHYITQDEWNRYCRNQSGALLKRALKRITLPEDVIFDDVRCSVCGGDYFPPSAIVRKKVICPYCGQNPNFTEIYQQLFWEIGIDDNNILDLLGFKLYETSKVKYTMTMEKINKEFLERLAEEQNTNVSVVLNEIINKARNKSYKTKNNNPTL